MTDAAKLIDSLPSRGPGRPSGLPKTGGRKAGTPNKRSLHGSDFMRTLTPKAKRRLSAILRGDDDGLALKACEVVLGYAFGRPVQSTMLGGDAAHPIRMDLSSIPNFEVARRLLFILRAADEDEAAQGASEIPVYETTARVVNGNGHAPDGLDDGFDDGDES